MDLTFDLDPSVDVRIDGQPVNTVGGKELHIDGVEELSVLDQMHSQYIDWVEEIDSVRCNALLLAAFAFERGGIDRNTAAKMAHEMALLAASLLREPSVEDWDFSTLGALRKIRRSDPDVEFAFAPPSAPKPAPLQFQQEPYPDDKPLPF
jgi:hypothetical protein